MSLTEIAVVIIVFVLLVLAFFGADKQMKKEQLEWQQFSLQHKCEIVGVKESSTTMGIGPTFSTKPGFSTMVMTIPAQTGWLCDNGITYWRNK